MKKYALNIDDRKVLVSRLMELTGLHSRYTFMPRCAYIVGSYTVEKEGTLVIEDNAAPEIIRTLLDEGIIREEGAETPETSETETACEESSESECEGSDETVDITEDMIHDPSTVAMGNTKDMEKAIEVLNEVKESIINAYASKSGLSHARIANLMSNETWMNAKKAVELGFADEILFSKKEDEPDSDPANPDKSEKTPDEEPGEGEEKKPFQQDTAGHLFSSRQMDLIVLNRLGVKPDTPAAQTEPPSDLPAEAGPVLDMDGKTEEGDYSYNVLMKQLECMK